MVYIVPENIDLSLFIALAFVHRVARRLSRRAKKSPPPPPLRYQYLQNAHEPQSCQAPPGAVKSAHQNHHHLLAHRSLLLLSLSLSLFLSLSFSFSFSFSLSKNARLSQSDFYSREHNCEVLKVVEPYIVLLNLIVSYLYILIINPTISFASASRTVMR